MQDIINKIVAKEGVIKLEVEACFLGRLRPSRGYYIVDPDSGRWYLHHDGTVKDGVKADSDKPAFWKSEKAAKLFFDEWKKGVIGNT